MAERWLSWEEAVELTRRWLSAAAGWERSRGPAIAEVRKAINSGEVRYRQPQPRSVLPGRITVVKRIEDLDVDIIDADLFDWLKRRFPRQDIARPPQPELNKASDATIRKFVRAVYDEADKNRSWPPNKDKELPKKVLERLKEAGFIATERHIAKIGGESEFAARRRKPGKTAASERKT